MSRVGPVGLDSDSQATSVETAGSATAAGTAVDRSRAEPGADRGLTILLVAGDAEAGAEATALLERAFQDRCHVECVSGAADAALTQSQHEHDVCLLLDGAAEDTIAFVRSSAESGQPPVIVIASNANTDLDLKAVDAGAADCIPGGELTAEALERSIRHALMREHVTARTRREIDALTAEIGKLNTLRDANHRFVDNACHDFRSPLTVIKEFSSIIAEGLAGDVNEEQSEFLDIILTRVDQLSHMVDAILDASRLESDLISVKREEHAARDIIAQVRPTLEQQASGVGAEITFAIDPSLPNVFADAESAGRIITNLGVNACKFAGDGGKVQVWARPNPDGGSISIGVTDNGPGIAPEHVRLIFERFRQIENDNEAEKAGFGLGLHIASELARVNYGTLSVESAPQNGSTFAFTLPTFDVDKLIPLHIKFLNTSRHGFQSVCMVVATANNTTDPETLGEVERFFNRQFRSYDLLLQLRPGNWLACVACDEQDISSITERIRNAYAEVNRNRPDGALPEIGLRSLGSWPLTSQDSGLSDAIRSAYALGGETGVH